MKFIYFLILTFSLPLAARAISLEETALIILDKSPETGYQEMSLQSDTEELKTISNLPDPEVGGEYLFAPEKEDNRWAAELSWGLEWPGVYSARAKEAKGKSDAARARIYAWRAERLAEIKNLLLDYIHAQKRLRLLDELNANNDSIYKLAENSSRGGEMTLLDLNKVKLEYANIKGARVAVVDEMGDIIASLSGIYGKDCEELLKDMDCQFPALVVPSSEKLALIKETSPEVLVALSEAQASRMTGEVAKMEALPSISVGYKHAYEESTHFNGATIGVSIPLFSSRGKQKAAKAGVMAAEYKAETTALEIEAEVFQTWKRLINMEQQIREITPLVENADYNTTLLKAYKGGVLTVIEYLSDRNYFTTAAMELVNLRLAAAKAQAKLEKYLAPVTF